MGKGNASGAVQAAIFPGILWPRVWRVIQLIEKWGTKKTKEDSTGILFYGWSALLGP